MVTSHHDNFSLSSFRAEAVVGTFVDLRPVKSNKTIGLVQVPLIRTESRGNIGLLFVLMFISHECTPIYEQVAFIKLKRAEYTTAQCSSESFLNLAHTVALLNMSLYLHWKKLYLE